MKPGFVFSLENVGYRDILRDITFDIEQGSFVSIAGPVGSGKSTLAKLLCGIIKPTDGNFQRSGYCALVSQNPDNLFVSDIVEEDVAFGPENLCEKPEEIRKKVDNSLIAVDMCDKALRRISSLSGGEKQRVAVAGALAYSSSCIVLDEPASMLDSEGKKRVLSYLRKLNREQGTAIILISHDLDEILSADRIIFMKNGTVDRDTEPACFYDFCSSPEEYGFVLSEKYKLIEMLFKDGIRLDSKCFDCDAVAKEVIRLCSKT